MIIITVLWEDQRSARANRFGPHELLLACLADDLGRDRGALERRVESRPQKGNGSLRKALKQELPRFAKSGPVIAVIDRDQIHDLLPRTPPPPSCMSGITTRFRQDAPGDYDIVFLVRNMETLVETVCRATGRDVPLNKPTPDERDRLLMAAVWGAPPQTRISIRSDCPSFDRLVTRVGRHLQPRPPV